MEFFMRYLLAILALASSIEAGVVLPSNFSSSFTQTITTEKGKVIRYGGSVAFKDQKLFKWNYTSPTKKEVCTNGVEILVIDHDLEQVSNYMVDDGVNLEKIMSKAKLIKGNEYKAVYKNNAYMITLDGSAKLQKVSYKDSLDNKVSIVFSNVAYDQPNFNQNTLKCNAPKGYDRVK
jgi:outer membrane lipoprotein carrier protein